MSGRCFIYNGGMVKYFWGLDTFGAREAIGLAAAEGGWEVRWVGKEELAEMPARSFLEQSRGGLFGKELVVIKNISGLPTGMQENVLEACEAEKEANCVVWDEGEPDKRSKIWRKFGGLGREFPVWGRGQVSEWLAEEAQARGGRIEKEAAGLMAERLGPDRRSLVAELERLLIMDEEVGVERVRREVAANETGEIFSLLAAVVKGERGEAIRSALALLREGNSEFYIISMLAYQYRTMLTIRLGADVGWKTIDIARNAGVKLFAVEKNEGYAKKYPAAYWREGLRRVLAVDFSIKQGKVDARTGLVMLVLSLSN